MTSRVGGGIIYFLVIIMTLLLRITSTMGVFDLTGVDSGIGFSLIVQICCFGLLPLGGWLIIVGRCEKDALKALPRTFGVVKCGIRGFLLTLSITLPLLLITGFVSNVWNGALSLMGYESGSSSASAQTVGALLTEIAVSAVLPAVFEELTHRGLLFATYRDAGWRVVVVSALLFALMHQYIVQTGYTFALGLCLAAMTYYTGSVLPAVFVHFFNNFISVVSGYAELVPAFGVINTVRNWLYGSLVGIIVLCILTVCSVVLVVFVFKVMRGDAVREGRLPSARFAPAAEGAIPLRRDVMLWLIVAMGAAATLFSLVWGLL